MQFNAIIVFSILTTKTKIILKGITFFNFVEYIQINSHCFSWIAKAKIVQEIAKVREKKVEERVERKTMEWRDQ